jgi:hypothetical protein
MVANAGLLSVTQKMWWGKGFVKARNCKKTPIEIAITAFNVKPSARSGVQLDSPKAFQHPNRTGIVDWIKHFKAFAGCVDAGRGKKPVGSHAKCATTDCKLALWNRGAPDGMREVAGDGCGDNDDL